MGSPWTGRESELNQRLRYAALTGNGVLTSRDLMNLGLTRRMICHRVAQGRLIPVLKDSYALPGTRLTLRGRCRAATGTVGERIVVSHTSALALHGLVRDPWSVHLSGEPGVFANRVRWASDSFGFNVVRHQTRSLPGEHITDVDGIRVTTAERAMRDYASIAKPADITKALVQGEKERSLRWDKLRAIVAESNGQKGLGILRNEIAEWEDCFADTDSDGEVDFLLMLREFVLPMPLVNVKVGDFVPDFLWPHLNLAAELDPYGTHKGRASHRQDHRKGIVLETGGLRLLRFTDEDLYRQKVRTATELRTIMEQQATLLGSSLFPDPTGTKVR